MLTQCIFNLMNYPKDDLRKGCIAVLTNAFRNRLVNETDVQHFNEIIRGQFQQSVDVEKSYFVPSGPRSSSFSCMVENEWKEIVTRNVTVCCNE